MYKILTKKLQFQCGGVLKWCLDFPSDGEPHSVEDLLENGLLFQGWVLAQGAREVSPYLRFSGRKHYLKLDRARPDVISRVLSGCPESHENLHCGFRAKISVGCDELFFGFEFAGCDFDAVKVELVGALRIVKGADGWLFLDNDTNQSVEQYCGRYLLGRRELADWRLYLDSLASLASREGFKHSVLIAPAKEMVLSEFYPFVKGDITPVEQILRLAKEGHNVLHPVNELKTMADSPFRKCDTHWSPKGALTGLLASLRTLGLDNNAVNELFSNDSYYSSLQSGDLGNKIFPPQSSPELMLKGMSYRQWVVYDNHLPNFGRVVMFYNDEALIAGKCLIFGSSSSYSFFSYVARVFSSVIFVHSSGSIDSQLVCDESPDYLIAQTNGRFVVRPPVFGYKLSEDMAAKVGSLSLFQIDEIQRRIGDSSSLPAGLMNSQIPSMFLGLLVDRARS